MFIRTKTIKTGQSKGLSQRRERKRWLFCYCIVVILFSLNSLNLNAHAVAEESSQNKEEKYRITFHHFLYKDPVLGASEHLSGEFPEPLVVNPSSEGSLEEHVKYLNYPGKMFVAFDRRNPANTEPYHALKLSHNDQWAHFRQGYSTYPFSGSYETAGYLPGSITLSSSYLVDFKKKQWPLLPGQKNILPYFSFAEPVDLLLLILERKSENSTSGSGTSANSETLLSSLSSSFYRLFKPHKPFYPGSQADSLIDIDIIPAYINQFLLLFANQAKQPQEQQIVLRIFQNDGTEEIKTISRTAFENLAQHCPISESGFWRYLLNVETRVFIQVVDLSAQCRLQTQQLITGLENSWLLPVMRETPRKGKRQSKKTTPPQQQQQESSSGSGQSAPDQKESRDDTTDDQNADNNPPPRPGNSGEHPADVDNQQTLVDTLVMSAGKGYTRDMKKIITIHGKELLYLKHSDRDVSFSGDTPLHAAVRFDQKDSISVIEQQTSAQEMAKLWELINHGGLTPRDLEKIFQLPLKAGPEEKKSEHSFVAPELQGSKWPELKAEPTPPITHSKTRKKIRNKKEAREEKEIDEILAFINGKSSLPLLSLTSPKPKEKSTVHNRAALIGELGVVARKYPLFSKRSMSEEERIEEILQKQLEFRALNSLRNEAENMSAAIEYNKKNKIRISECEDLIQGALQFKKRYEDFCNQPENISYKNLTIRIQKNFEEHQIRLHLNIRHSFTIFYEAYFNEHENYYEEIKAFFINAPDNHQEVEHYLTRKMLFQSALIDNLYRVIILAEHLPNSEEQKGVLEIAHNLMRKHSQDAGIIMTDIYETFTYYPGLCNILRPALCDDFDYNSDLPLPSWQGVKNEYASGFWVRLLYKHKELSRGRHLVEIIEGLDLNPSTTTIPSALDAMRQLLTVELNKLQNESLSLPVRANSLKVLTKAKNSAKHGWLAAQNQGIMANTAPVVGMFCNSQINLMVINLTLSKFNTAEQQFYAWIEQERAILIQTKQEEIKQLLKEEAEDKQREAERKKVAAQINRHLAARKERKVTLSKSEATATPEIPQTETEQTQASVESVQENLITEFLRETSQALQHHDHGQYQLILSECHELLTQDIPPDQAAMLSLYMAEIHIDMGISLIKRINKARERIIEYNNALKITGKLPQQEVYRDFRGVIFEIPEIEKQAQHHLDSTIWILNGVYIPENSELESSYHIIKNSFQLLVRRLRSIEEKKKQYDMQQIIELRRELIVTTRKPQASAQKTSGITFKAIKDAALCDEKISEMVPKWKAVLDTFEAQTFTKKQ